MKKITFVGLWSFLMLSGLALAEQTGQEKKGSPMQDMMQEMMKGKESGEDGTGGMMDQCTAMMGSGKTESGETKEGQKK